MVHQRNDQVGFTLVEILVVIVIIGIILSIGVMSLGLLGNDKELQTAAKRFIALTEVTRDEAALQAREFGIELMREGYRFVEYDGLTGVWVEVLADPILKPRELDEGLEFELYLEDKQIVLNENPLELEDPEKKTSFNSSGKTYAPHLLLYSSGDTTPFALHVVRASDRARVIIQGDAIGMVEIESADED